ncbi:ABC transporter permease [Hydrogenophaga sp. Root209]|uniref:branched-chain amino acid ABC transporter permease n=1 Tax=Hydrogenophaga sp. Root209 TaxID=1736490 RepID=UPI0006FE85C3|nr:branched-chain amino acid ABC transporter permease [Hydrogenophaga sp. Root209]KRC00479.1 ABC transporter permease [Hydrogenophaga sp. Root209]
MKTSELLRPSLAIPLLVFAGLAALPFVATAMDQSFYIALVARMIIYAIAASALNLALGYGGLVSFGHALFMGLGSYAVAISAEHGVGSGWVHLAITLVVCGAVGWITGLISLRTSGIAFIMITLAFAQMGYYLFVSLKQYGGDDGLPVAISSKFGPLDLGRIEVLYSVALLILVLSTWWLAKLRSSPFGMALRGARQNRRRVHALGLPTLRYQLVAYVFSGLLCGVSGLLLANLNAFASPSTLAWVISGELIVMVVIGGIGTVFGPVLGAIAFLGLEEIIKGITEHWMVVFGPLIVVIALLRNQGLAGLLAMWDRPPRDDEVAGNRTTKEAAANVVAKEIK